MRAKIYYKVEESDYHVTVEDIKFFFSSLFYLNKFKEKFEENRETLKYKLSSRYNIEIVANSYFDIILYSQIEKRGFHIFNTNKGVVYKCLKDITLNGEIKTSKNLTELSEISTPR